jgi:hypothetical protein
MNLAEQNLATGGANLVKLVLVVVANDFSRSLLFAEGNHNTSSVGEDAFATGSLDDSLHRDFSLCLRLNLDFAVDNQVNLHEMRVSVSRRVARVLDFLSNLFHEGLDAHVSHGVRSTKVFGHFDVEGDGEFFHCEVSIPRVEKLVNNF